TMTCTFGTVVSNISLRLLWMSSSGAIPARSNRGSTSSRMRPLVRAMTIFWLSLALMAVRSSSVSGGDAADARAQQLQFFLDAFVTTVDVVDAIDNRLVFRHQAGNDQACRGSQVGRHDRCPLE